VRIVPPMPQFYLRPQTADEIVDLIARRSLDALGIHEALPTEKRWRANDE
jgi:3-polyprenyl-4-hydroxybenzoate decarboxylase